jgi:exodeoxyribonuclease V alpha subunit
MMSQTSELAELLAAAGTPENLRTRVTAHLGATAAERLRADPWELLLVPGVRPEQADHFARHVLGPTDPGDVRRGRALVTHLLMKAAEAGHTATPAPDVRSALAALGVPDGPRAIEAALDEARVMAFIEEPAYGGDADDQDFAHDIDGEFDGDGPPEPAETLALARHALAEEAVAEGVVRLAATAEPLLDDDVLGGDHPVAHPVAVAAAVRYGVSVVTGPGADVEPALAALAALAAGHGLRIAVAAATARAAADLGAVTGAVATTLHRLLEPQEAPGGVAFARGEQRPLEADLVVVPDATVLDVEMAAALVEACTEGTHLVLCGDPAACPPAGPGRVFADLVESATVPVIPVSATPVGGAAAARPGGGPIRRLSEAVGRGELPSVDAPGREVVIVPAAGAAEAVHRTVQLLTDSIPRALGISADEIQVVTPARRGDAGATVLNAAFKARLNPGRGEHGGFDVGDRVVVSGPLPQAATGETGIVTGFGAGGLEITFPDGPAMVPVPLLPRLRHGWAITVHQAQGTCWPAVVAVLPAEAAGLLSRPLVAAAFTRARRHLSVVHAAGPALARAVREIDAPPRRTRLVGLLGG